MLLTMENYRSMKTESKSDIFLSLICLAGLREFDLPKLLYWNWLHPQKNLQAISAEPNNVLDWLHNCCNYSVFY